MQKKLACMPNDHMEEDEPSILITVEDDGPTIFVQVVIPSLYTKEPTTFLLTIDEDAAAEKLYQVALKAKSNLRRAKHQYQ